MNFKEGIDRKWHPQQQTFRRECPAKVQGPPIDRIDEASLTTLNTAAESITSHYYQSVNNLSDLTSFYVNSTPRYGIPADITVNGLAVSSPADYKTLLEGQGRHAHYEIESLDAHILNPSFLFGAPPNLHDSDRAERNGGRMSIAVTVMGRVQFGKGREAPQKMFNETLVLVPNWDAMARNPPRGLKRWLIMSQNFRAL